MVNEYVKFFENYKNLFRQYKKETGKIPVNDGKLTQEFREFREDIEENEQWEKFLQFEEIDSKIN